MKGVFVPMYQILKCFFWETHVDMGFFDFEVQLHNTNFVEI